MELDVLFENFREYMILGGMPAVVDRFVRDKDSLIPLEVKAMDGATRSLNNLINQKIGRYTFRN